MPITGSWSATLTVILSLLVLGTSASCGTRPDAGNTEAREAVEAKELPRTLTIYRTDERGLVNGDCGAVTREDWPLPDPPPDDLPTAAIREVLRDIQPSSPLHRRGTKPLAEYFRGVKLQDGTAILSFDEGALEYLNNAACAQAAVKSPMIRTLLEFSNISAVEFEIDDEIFRDWDA